uniref:Uncharacterized protein n=1 Tax=Anguilla anguilla TaxID=7936 RepID=A0A0E9RYC6_ANGAN
METCCHFIFFYDHAFLIMFYFNLILETWNVFLPLETFEKFEMIFFKISCHALSMKRAIKYYLSPF